MWVEELRLKNIKCFEDVTIKFGADGKPFPWVTLIGENGSGKSTVLQILGGMWAYPLSDRVFPWSKYRKTNASTGYAGVKFCMDHSDKLSNKESLEEVLHKMTFDNDGPAKISSKIVYKENSQEILNKLDVLLKIKNEQSKGWLASGYGPHRFTTKEDVRGLPRLPEQQLYRNFITLFEEKEPLDAIINWLVYLEIQIFKSETEEEKARAKRR